LEPLPVLAIVPQVSAPSLTHCVSVAFWRYPAMPPRHTEMLAASLPANAIAALLVQEVILPSA